MGANCTSETLMILMSIENWSVTTLKSCDLEGLGLVNTSAFIFMCDLD